MRETQRERERTVTVRATRKRRPIIVSIWRINDARDRKQRQHQVGEARERLEELVSIGVLW